MTNANWHSYIEETPELEEIVVILLNNKTPVVAKFNDMGFTDDGLEFENVTHWLRLPKLPANKKEMTIKNKH